MKILPIVLLALSTSVMAQDVKVVDETMEFNWEPPATRVDGTPMGPDEIGKYDLNCAGNTVWISPEQIEGGYTAQTADILPEYGEYTCKVATVDTDGLRSQWSNEVLVSWPEPIMGTPQAPTGLGTEF